MNCLQNVPTAIALITTTLANVGFILDEARSQPWKQFVIERIWAL
jgi:hypothetical protein